MLLYVFGIILKILKVFFLLLYVKGSLTPRQVNMNDRLSPDSDRNGEATASSPALALSNFSFGIGPYGE